jgi:uncharacterized protein YuzE
VELKGAAVITDKLENDIFLELGAENSEVVAGFVWRAMKYIIERRPHEIVTIAILNEAAYNVYDAAFGAARAKQIN